MNEKMISDDLKRHYYFFRKKKGFAYGIGSGCHQKRSHIRLSSKAAACRTGASKGAALTLSSLHIHVPLFWAQHALTAIPRVYPEGYGV